MVVPLAARGTVDGVKLLLLLPLMPAPNNTPVPAPSASGVPLQLRPKSGLLLQVTPLCQRKVGHGVPVTVAPKVVPSPSTMLRTTGWLVKLVNCVDVVTASGEAGLSTQTVTAGVPLLLHTCR